MDVSTIARVGHIVHCTQLWCENWCIFLDGLQLSHDEGLREGLACLTSYERCNRVLTSWVNSRKGFGTLENLLHTLEGAGLHNVADELQRNLINPIRTEFVRQVIQDQGSQTSAISMVHWTSVDDSPPPPSSQKKSSGRIGQRFWTALRNLGLLLIAVVLCVGMFRMVEYWCSHPGKMDDVQGNRRYPNEEESTRCGGRVIVVNDGSMETPTPGCHFDIYEEMHFIGGNLTSKDLCHVLSEFYNLRFLKFAKFTILDGGSDFVPKIQRSLVSLYISFSVLSNFLTFFENYTFSFPQLKNVTLVSTTVDVRDGGKIQKLFLTSFAQKSEKRLVCQNGPGCHLLKRSSVLVGMFSISG